MATQIIYKYFLWNTGNEDSYVSLHISLIISSE